MLLLYLKNLLFLVQGLIKIFNFEIITFQKIICNLEQARVDANTHTHNGGGFDDCYVNLIKIKERNNLI